MEISHPWHPHPLFLSEEVKLGDQCSICKKELDGNLFYVCVDCKYYVHKSCAQFPVEIQHNFHPPHPLALCIGYDFACDSCHKKFGNNELRFRCSDCDFDLDVKCALMKDIDVEGKEFIRHFTHQHPLTICSKDGDNPLNCFACKKTSSDLFYGCPPCEYFLHKSCSKISTHVLHAIHPQHALSLAVKFGTCYYCDSYDHTWKYNCGFCNFHVDASCLIESTKDVPNSCFLCGKQHMDSDSCVNSLYFINQSCIQLPEEIEVEFHSRKLLLMLDTKDFLCNSCHKRFETQWHYGCEECNFKMDVVCALMPSNSISRVSSDAGWQYGRGSSWRRTMSSSATAEREKKEETTQVSSSYWGISRPKIKKEDGSEWPWNCFMPWETYTSNVSIDLTKHHRPTTFVDKVAFRTLRLLRIPVDLFFQERRGCHAVLLETVAAVPGMVAGMLLHLKSLRRFEHSGGWIKALLEEAENERMHLMTMIEIVKPKWHEKLLVFAVQGGFFNLYFSLYLMSPKLAHRITGYLQEEAVRSYTEYWDAIDAGKIENTPAPAIAIDYWRLPKDAKLKDVITVIRADEAHHRDVNHFASDVLFEGKQLKEAPAPVGYH